MQPGGKPRVAVHKFSSCDGCQLAFLNAGEALLELAGLVDIVHFVEAGLVNSTAEVDIAFIEGSVTTPDEVERIAAIRKQSGYLVTLGACATAGGLQALRNINESRGWRDAIYALPEHINSLATSSPIAAHVKVDLELWGCPVNGQQVMAAVRSLLAGVVPAVAHDKLCMACKRRQNVCVAVAKGEACLGPVTRTGCGAICPAFGRGCYACYGPSEQPNSSALAEHLQQLGLSTEDIARRFLFINNSAPEFRKEGLKWRDGEHE